MPLGGYRGLLCVGWDIKPYSFTYKISPNSTCCITSLQDATITTCHASRDVTCRACCALLVPTWRTTKQ